MRSTVSNRQLVFVLYITIITISVINVAKLQAVSAGHGAWIPLLITGLAYGTMGALILRLNSQFEGDTLFEYSGKLIGKFGAVVLAIVYLLFFMIFSSYYCITFFQMIKANFLPKTPEWLLLLVSMPFLGLMAYKGMTNCARLAELVGIVYFAVTLFLFVTMFWQGRLTNILPLYIRSETGRYLGAVKNTLDQFTGIAFLTLIPVAKGDKRISKIAFFTMLGIAAFYILDVYGSYAMVGMDEIQKYKYPFVDAIRLVEYKNVEFFQRVDITYHTIGFMQIFVAKGIVYLAVVEYMSKLLPKVRRLTVVIITGLLAYSIDIFAMGIPRIGDRLISLRTYLSIAVSFIIPCALMIIAKVRKNGKKSA